MNERNAYQHKKNQFKIVNEIKNIYWTTENKIMENKFRVSKRYQEKFQKKRMEGMTRSIDLKIKKQFCFLFLKWRNTRILRCRCHSKYWAVKKSILPCSWAKRFKIIKLASLPKHIFRLNIIPTKIPARFFMELNKMILKLLSAEFYHY